MDALSPCTPSVLSAHIDVRRRTAAPALRRRPVDDILAALDRVIANWLRPDFPLRRRAEAELPAVTGFSPETICHGMRFLLAPLRAGGMRALLDSELGDRRTLDRMCDGRRALGPPVILHVLSGNIPGLAAVPVLLSLAVKSTVIVKPAMGDPLFPELLAASIAEVDAQLADCVCIAPWRGGDTAVEAVAFRDADLVVASGSDAAIAAIRARVAGRFIGHGHKISFAVVGREALADDAAARDLARRLAYDVSLWDQQGCLSPQLCYVEAGGHVSPAHFAELLAGALADYAHTLPPRRMEIEEHAAVQRFRHAADWQPDTVLLASKGSTEWTVSVEPDARFLPTCLHRCIRVKVVDDSAVLADVLPPHRAHLEAAGVATGNARAAALGELLGAAGVHRLCPIGRMQVPPLTWRQGGRPRVGEWVEWISDEG